MTELSALLQPEFKPADYPRTYRAAGGSAVFLTVIGVIGVIGGALGSWYFGFHLEPATVVQRLIGEVVFGALCLGGIYLLLLVARFKIVLEADSIEVQTALFRRVLLRSNISGWRLVQASNSPATIWLVPRAGSGKTLQLALMFRRDAAFESWLDTLPNLDAQEADASEQEIARNEDAGLTPDQRFASLAQAKKLATALNIAGFLGLVWSFAYPYPLPLLTIILAALPWAAVLIVSRSHGLIHVDTRRNDPRPQVAGALMIPGVALALGTIRGPHILHWKPMAWLPVAIGIALLAAALAADRSPKQKGSVLALFAVSLFYGYGGVVELNAVFDNSPAATYSVPVVSKHISHGRSTSYYLNLSAWEREPEQTQVSVARDFYESVQPGDSVCVIFRTGALRIPWYRVARCG